MQLRCNMAQWLGYVIVRRFAGQAAPPAATWGQTEMMPLCLLWGWRPGFLFRVQGFKIYVSMVTPTQNAPHLYGSPFHAAAPCPQPCLLYALSSPDLRVSHLALSTDSVCRVQVEKEMLLKAEIVIA